MEVLYTPAIHDSIRTSEMSWPKIAVKIIGRQRSLANTHFRDEAARYSPTNWSLGDLVRL